MTGLVQKRIFVIAGSVLLLAGLVGYLLRDRTPTPDRAVLEPIASEGSDQAPEAPPPPPLQSSQFTGFQSRNAVGMLEDWLNSIDKNSLSMNTGSPEVIQLLKQNLDRNQAFYQRVQEILEDETADISKKQGLIFALDRAARPSVIRLLAELSRLNLTGTLKQAVLSAIANDGEYYWDKGSAAQTVPVLQQLWLQSEDPEILRAAATAMMRVGNPEGIDTLLEAVLGGGKSLAEVEQSSDTRVAAAWSALRNAYGGEIVSTLQQRLQLNTSIAETSIVSSLLATIGNAGNTDARSALLSWARNAGDQYAPAVRAAFSLFGTLDSRQYFTAALAQNPTFQSNLVKSAIVSVLQH